MSHRTVPFLMVVALAVAVLLLAPDPPPAVAQPAAPANALVNGDAEDGASDPDGWRKEGWKTQDGDFTWSTVTPHAGTHSLGLDHRTTSNDLRWIQRVPVTPGHLYRLSGWVRTEGVAGGAGARLGVLETGRATTALFGTNGWTFVSTVVEVGDRTSVDVFARIGDFGAAGLGRAWFDDLALVDTATEASGTGQPAGWKVLVVVYPNTDLTTSEQTTDDPHVGERRYRGTLGVDERDAVVSTARAFVDVDVPQLTSGHMVPTVTVRVVERAPVLSRIASGWWVDAPAAAADTSGEFDSVIVLWNARATNEATGRSVRINSFGGLTPGFGTGQTYSAIPVPLDQDNRNRNVFKHEFGHAILDYHGTLDPGRRMQVVYPDGTTDEDNHARPGAYVTCPSGTAYDWRDETPDDPLPNSIYHNLGGFTHDYYSGTVALATDPTRCLGIPRAGWARGGPLVLRGDQSPPALSIADVAGLEGDTGTRQLVFTVGLSEATSSPVTVRYRVMPGTAESPADVVSGAGVVTVPRGATTVAVPVTVNGDTGPEVDETFTVLLDDAVNAFLADAEAVGTVVTDDVRCAGRAATLRGTPGADVLTGTGGADVIIGFGGDDRIDGRGGNDTVCGLTGDDVLYGGSGNDVLEGGDGVDRCIDSGSSTVRRSCEGTS